MKRKFLTPIILAFALFIIKTSHASPICPKAFKCENFNQIISPELAKNTAIPEGVVKKGGKLKLDRIKKYDSFSSSRGPRSLKSKDKNGENTWQITETLENWSLTSGTSYKPKDNFEFSFGGFFTPKKNLNDLKQEDKFGPLKQKTGDMEQFGIILGLKFNLN